ncbi:MAG: helix-turn-helix domain-containing protein [Altererythrobacter sp.]
MTTHPDPRSFDGASDHAAAFAPSTPEEVSRHDGWTPARQAAFLRELAATHNVSAAARAVGMSRQSAYQLRTRLREEPFGKAWEAAFVTRFDVLAEAALDRALNGVEVQHYYNGELVGTSRKYDERLTLALLARRENFARPRPSAYDPASAFGAEDLSGLIERVEHGPEDWLDTPEDEWAALYGETADEAAGGTEGAGPPPDVTTGRADD